MAKVIHIRATVIRPDGTELLETLFFGIEDGPKLETDIQQILGRPHLSSVHLVYGNVTHVYDSVDVYPKKMKDEKWEEEEAAREA